MILEKGIEKENVTQSGIILPENNNKERPFMYEVVAVWPGKKDVEMNVSIGDKVLCGQYAGDEVKVNDEDYKIVAMDYILAKVS